MAKDSVDDMGNRLGAVVLETIRGAKLPLLLRSGKLLDRSRTLAGKPANFFLACHRPSAFSDPLRGGSSGPVPDWEALDRRHRIHVRCTLASVPAPAQFVSCGDASVTSLGDLASGLRQTGMETADTHNVDRGPNQLFLAAGAGCELGARAFLPRTACDAGLELSAALSARRADTGLLANTFDTSALGGQTESFNCSWTQELLNRAGTSEDARAYIAGCLTLLDLRQSSLCGFKQRVRSDRFAGCVFHP